MLKQRNTVASTAVPYPEERTSKKVMEYANQNGQSTHKEDKKGRKPKSSILQNI